MVLVVNKIGRTSIGNTKEQQTVIAGDLMKVITSYKSNDLQRSFLSTDDFFQLSAKLTKKLKLNYLSVADIIFLQNNLNKFVSEHDTLAKITALLYTIADQIRLAIKSTTLDKDAFALEETVRHRKNILTDGRNICLKELKEIANQCKK